MPIVGSLANASARGLGWGAAAVGFAFELVKPSSIAKTGASSTATVSALGSVEFDLCETLSLNGVFSSAYDNYVIVMRHVAASGDNLIQGRLRVGGVDASSGAYTWQSLYATSTTVAGARNSATSAYAGGTSATQRSGDVLYLYGPALAQPTAFRAVGSYGYLSATVQDFASTHSLSTAYDGITLIPASSTISGRVAVYGMRG